MKSLRQLNEPCPKCGASLNDDCRHSNSKANSLKAKRDWERIEAWKLANGYGGIKQSSKYNNNHQ